MPPPPHLTPAQLAKQAERKAAKLARKAALADVNPRQMTPDEAARRRIIQRKWIPVGSVEKGDGTQTARVVTWNMLAQTLVRRELFPGSDCLRWGDRKAMLQAEMETHREADVICLQECDRLADMRDSVPEHEAVEARGVGKLHGLVVLYRASKWTARVTRAVALDLELLSPEASGPIAQRGVSRQTRNMGLVVALENKAKPGQGFIVATTHLFWHPKFEYERTRQIIVLARAIRKLQQEEGLESWPAMLAGDLNTQPAESAYQILAAPGDILHPSMAESMNMSRLVHTSVVKVGEMPSESEPPSQSGSGTATPVAKEKDDEDELPDTDERSIAGTRPPTDADGIRTLEELLVMAQEVLPEPARSAYGTTKWGTETYAARGGFKDGATGAGGNEPAYTCFTPLFKLTLDYLFILPPGKAPRVEFTELLEPPNVEELGEGLPRKGISASDHLPLGCEFVWTPAA